MKFININSYTYLYTPKRMMSTCLIITIVWKSCPTLVAILLWHPFYNYTYQCHPHNLSDIIMDDQFALNTGTINGSINIVWYGTCSFELNESLQSVKTEPYGTEMERVQPNKYKLFWYYFYCSMRWLNCSKEPWTVDGFISFPNNE